MIFTPQIKNDPRANQLRCHLASSQVKLYGCLAPANPTPLHLWRSKYHFRPTHTVDGQKNSTPWTTLPPNFKVAFHFSKGLRRVGQGDISSLIMTCPRAHCVTLTSGGRGWIFSSINCPGMQAACGIQTCWVEKHVCVCVCNVFHSFSSPYINGLRHEMQAYWEKTIWAQCCFFKLLLLLTSPHHTQSGLSAIASGEGFHIHKGP